jgi:hypothetical protein
MTGSAISFQASDKSEELFVSIIKQATWDNNTKKGSFLSNRNKPGFYVTIKFNQAEVGTILDALERFYEFTAFHSSAKATTQIHFGPSEGEAPTSFVFRATQTDKQDTSQKASFFIPISFGESRLIREYLIHYLHKSFKIAAKASAAKKGEEPQAEIPASPAEPAAAPETEPPPPVPEEGLSAGAEASLANSNDW